MRLFPQTSGGLQDHTPIDAWAIPNPDSITQPFPAAIGSPFSLGANFSWPDITGLAGLSYAFDYNNARFVLADQFTRTDGTGSGNVDNNLLDQLPWIDSALAGKPEGGHAFFFSHKNLIGENHADVLFGANPSSNIPGQQSFFRSLDRNGVRYAVSGHDHIHQRSIVTSPNATQAVQQIICASDSSKFHIPSGSPERPGTVNNDAGFNIPGNGISHPRETPLAQERNTIGYYLFNVDDECVKVFYYSARVYPSSASGDYVISSTPTLNFVLRETFGYCLNGKEFRVGPGESYTRVQDSFSNTTAAILSGGNGNLERDGSLRLLSSAVDTGWSLQTRETASDILHLWGMAHSSGSDQTDVYTLSMNYDPQGVRKGRLRSGSFGLATRDERGNWVTAVDMNFGGTKNFVLGPWHPSYKLGTYGVDPSTQTAWAVINYNGDFAVGRNLRPFRDMDSARAQ